MIENDMLLCFIDQVGKCNYHLGAAYMIANLRQKGYRARMFVNYQNEGLEQIVDEILSYNTRSIGFTLYDTNYFLVKELCYKLKEKRNDIFVFLGGATVTFRYDKILEDCLACDGCILFEGEVTAIEIMHYLEDKITKQEIKNFAYLNEFGELVKNEDRIISKNLDEFPSPYLTGAIDPVDYYKNHKNSWHRMVQLISSRGCIFSCKYCSNTVLGHHIIRVHSIERTIEEMKFLKKIFDENKIKARVQFMDDIFTFSKKRTIEFCKRVIHENIGLEFAIQTRPDCIDEEQIKLLSEAGCCAINFGLENTNPSVLYSMGKCARTDLDEMKCREWEYIEATKRAVKWANENKIYVAVNMIIGWENQSYQSYLKDIDFLEKLGADYINTASLIYYPGTAIYQQAADRVKEKIKYIEKNCGLIFSFTYKFFPELYPFEHNRIVNTKRESSEYFSVRRKVILQAIMGIRNSFPLQTIIYQDMYPDYDWLKKNVNATTKIVFFKENDFGNWYFSTYAFAYDYKIHKTIQEYNNLERIDKDNLDPSMHIDDKVEMKLICLDDFQDAENFFQNLTSQNINEITNQFSVTKSNKLISNYCRWCSSEECPAINLSRLLIREDGIYTCPKGMKICNMESKIDWNLIERRMREWASEVRERRGCDQCEVKAFCTKCMALCDITEEQYCELQRKISRRKNKMIYDIKKIESFSE